MSSFRAAGGLGATTPWGCGLAFGILARLRGGVVPPVPPFLPSFNFADARNSQYLPLLSTDF